jgi:hypothetical protein
VDTYPDSALYLLNSIEPEEMTGKRDKARYGLLWTLAKIKTAGDAKIEDKLVDSLFDDAYSLFGTATHPSRESMLAHYIKALREDASEKSIVEFDEAIRLSAGKNADYYRMMACFNKAILYHNAYSSEDEVANVIQGERYLSSTKDLGVLLFATRTSAVAYLGAGEDDKAELYFRKMQNIADTIGDREKSNEARLFIATLAGLKGEYAECSAVIDSLLYSGELTTMLPLNAYAYALSLISQGRFAEVDQLIGELKKDADKETKNLYSALLPKLYAGKGDYRRAYELQDSLIKYNNEVVEEKLRFSLSRKERDLKEELFILKENHSHNRILIHKLYVVVLCMGAWIVILILILVNNKYLKREKNMRHIHREKEMDGLNFASQLAELQKQKAELEEALDVLTHQLEEMKQSQVLSKEKEREIETYEKLLAHLKEERWEIQMSAVRAEARLCNSLMKIKDKSKLAQRDMILSKYRDQVFVETLIKEVNGYTDGLIDYLKNDLRLQYEGMMVVVLDICGFSYEGIGGILNLTPKAASVRKTRIKKYIQDNSGADKIDWIKRYIPMMGK